MGLDCGMRCLKFMLCVFNLVFWVSAEFNPVLGEWFSQLTFHVRNTVLSSFSLENKNIMDSAF